MVVPEAPLRQTKYGLAPDGEGWFVMNARESRWRDTCPLGFYCNFEGKRRFSELGFNLNILEPGQPIGMYHLENAQEGFLVLAGACLLIVEGQERKLEAWDFFHCPPRTAHMIVGAGDGPAVVMAVGSRGHTRKRFVYPVDSTASKHGAAVAQETTKPDEAYASFPRSSRTVYREGWLPDL